MAGTMEATAGDGDCQVSPVTEEHVTGHGRLAR